MPSRTTGRISGPCCSILQGRTDYNHRHEMLAESSPCFTLHKRKPRMFARNLLSRLLLVSGIKREFEDVLEAYTYNTIKAINTAASDIVSTKMAESDFVTTHELALVSDKIVRGLTSSTVITCTKIGVDDIADDMQKALEKIKAITATVDGIEHTVNDIEGTVDDMQHTVDSISDTNTESLLEEIQESLVEIKSLLGESTRVYVVERKLDAILACVEELALMSPTGGIEKKLDSILTWISNIDQKIDSNHAEIYNALTGGLRVVYDPSLATSAKKERDQDLLRHLVEAGIIQEDANV